jgi:tRNA-specific 2-thiouridylase
MNKKIKVMIGLSGGVDSAVAAYLLKEQGYDVVGCFMRNWDAMANNDILGNPTLNEPQCPQEKDYDDAVATAKSLNIPLLRIDFIKEYWDEVFSNFLSEYKAGRTPNPDILCNKFIKFDAFLKFAKEEKCDFIAMGHYAKKVQIDGIFYLSKCKDQNKDQTYFLSQLNEMQIASCLFPLGDIEKPKVREIAHNLNLKIADKKDSTGVCFIGERNFKQFLENYIPAKEGNIVDIETNRILGKHSGVLYYTIGQRKGLGIGGISHENSIGWFVVKKDVKNNILYVAKGDENKYLMSDYCIVKNLNFVNDNFPIFSRHVGCKFRYRQKDNPVSIILIAKDTIKVTYDFPIKAVTSGQAAVFYDGDIMIGGGTIEEVYRNNKRIDI